MNLVFYRLARKTRNKTGHLRNIRVVLRLIFFILENKMVREKQCTVW